jgi:hypothetical protein
LAQKGKGLTRSEIIEICKLTSGGYTTQLLDELKESGFITPYIPFGKTSKDSIYELTDEYSLFYIKFIENSRARGQGYSTATSWKSWSGIAYESIGMKYIDQIKNAIGIKNVYSEVSVWRYQPKSANEQGAQIDLLIDRADRCINRCINLCEMEFASDTFEVTKAYAKELDNKLKIFQAQTKTKKSLFMTMVTTYGVKNIENYPGLIQQQITMDVLFES